MKQIETKRGARERFIGMFYTLALFTEESLMNVSWIVALRADLHVHVQRVDGGQERTLADSENGSGIPFTPLF